MPYNSTVTKISQDLVYSCETLPLPKDASKIKDHMMWYESVWQEGEHLWIGTIDKELFLFDPDNEIYNDILNFFITESYKKTKPDSYEWDRSGDTDLENFCKMVWLTKVYFNEGFRNPVGAHWNPRIQKKVIHPGGCRNKILKMFHSGPIDVIYFNTGGFYVDWMENLEYVSMAELRDRGFICGVTPDHTSLIPHPMKDTNVIPNGVEQAFNGIKQQLSDPKFKIYMNTAMITHDMNSSDLVYSLFPWITNDITEASITIKFLTKPDLNDVSTAVLAGLAGIRFTNDRLKVGLIR